MKRVQHEKVQHVKKKQGKLQYDRMQHEKSATLNFDHPEVNAVTTLVQKNIKEISSFTA